MAAGLQADTLSSEFFRNFMPETLYLVPGERAVPQIDEEAAVAATPEAMVSSAWPAAAAAIPELPVAAAVKKYALLGENRRGVVVLVTLPEQEFGQLPQLEFLQKILSAIGLQSADVAYANNISGQTARFEELQAELQVNYLISFGSRLDTDLPHDRFTLYAPVRLGNVPLVFSQPLAMLERDVEQKKLLWNALKQAFL